MYFLATDLSNVRCGDVLIAVFPSGAQRICSVSSIHSGIINCRSFLTAENFGFNVLTGLEISTDREQMGKIVLILDRSSHLKGIFSELDNRYTNGEGRERFRLKGEEKQALLSVNPFIRSVSQNITDDILIFFENIF